LLVNQPVSNSLSRIILQKRSVVPFFALGNDPNTISIQTTGLILTLTRSLILQNSAPSKNPLQISDTLLTESFKAAEYCVGPGVEGVANLVFDVPKHARGVRGGTREGGEEDEPRFSEGMFEVKCVISVKIGMGVGRYSKAPL